MAGERLDAITWRVADKTWPETACPPGPPQGGMGSSGEVQFDGGKA